MRLTQWSFFQITYLHLIQIKANVRDWTRAEDFTPGNEGVTPSSNFWAVFMRNLRHMLKSPGWSLSHNYLTAHLLNKNLLEWFIILCHCWVLYIILCRCKCSKSAWPESIRCICCLPQGVVWVCILICVDWYWSWLWNKVRFVAIL